MCWEQIGPLFVQGLLHFEIIWSTWLLKLSLSSTMIPKNFVSSEEEIATSLTKISLSNLADSQMQIVAAILWRSPRMVKKWVSSFDSILEKFVWLEFIETTILWQGDSDHHFEWQFMKSETLDTILWWIKMIGVLYKVQWGNIFRYVTYIVHILGCAEVFSVWSWVFRIYPTLEEPVAVASIYWRGYLRVYHKGNINIRVFNTSMEI